MGILTVAVGVGRLAASSARALGTTMIATASGPIKVAALRAGGISEVLDVAKPGFVPRVLGMTGGGVDVVYDLVGAATFDKSVAVARRGGDHVHFGSASGPPRIDRAALAERAIAYTRPNTGDFIKGRAALMEASADLWSAVETGILPPPVIERYPLGLFGRASRRRRSAPRTGDLLVAHRQREAADLRDPTCA